MCEIEQKWAKVTENAPNTVQQWWWGEILKKYNEPGRDGHDMSYLQAKLQELEKIELKLRNTNAFLLAMFFQHFHYDSKGSDVTGTNIETFEKYAAEAALPTSDPDLYNQVKVLLEATVSYSTEEGAFGEEDIHYFLDLDVAWLGHSPEEYKAHTDLVAKEYASLDPTAYKRLRQRVLQSFLLIPNIFSTRIFREKYEATARENIQRELQELQKA